MQEKLNHKGQEVSPVASTGLGLPPVTESKKSGHDFTS